MAFIGTSVTIAPAVATYFLPLFPDVMPTTLPGGTSLTIASVEHPLTLKIMTVAALVFTPIVLVYTVLDLLGLPQAAQHAAHPGPGPRPLTAGGPPPMRPSTLDC